MEWGGRSNVDINCCIQRGLVNYHSYGLIVMNREGYPYSLTASIKYRCCHFQYSGEKGLLSVRPVDIVRSVLYVQLMNELHQLLFYTATYQP